MNEGMAAFGLSQIAYTYKDKTGAVLEASCPAYDVDHAKRFAAAWCDLYHVTLVSVNGAAVREDSVQGGLF